MASADKRLYSSTLPSWNLKRAMPRISPTAPASILRWWDRRARLPGQATPFPRILKADGWDAASPLPACPSSNAGTAMYRSLTRLRRVRVIASNAVVAAVGAASCVTGLVRASRGALALTVCAVLSEERWRVEEKGPGIGADHGFSIRSTLMIAASTRAAFPDNRREAFLVRSRGWRRR